MNVYHGVDFSGGKAHRSRIWVSTWRGDEITTRSGFSHADLVRSIAESTGEGDVLHYWLIDAPFALARVQLEAHGCKLTWDAAVDWLASYSSARDWRRACRAVSRKEPRREIDRVAQTPMAPSNIRMFKQTWHCIVSVLMPLRHESRLAILPFDAEKSASSTTGGARALVGEGCPSSFLKQNSWPASGYKGRGPACRDKRGELLKLLRAREQWALQQDLVDTIVADHEGDALDSLLLLPSAKRFSETDSVELLRREPTASLEGWVYV